MTRHTRIAAAISAGAVLAAMLTGTAAAQSAPGPNSAACEAAKVRVTSLAADLDKAQQAVQAARNAAVDPAGPGNDDGVPAGVDPDATQVDPEGDPTGLDGAADRIEVDGSDTPEVGDIPPFGADDQPETDGSDTPEGSPLDTNEPVVGADDGDGAEITPAEQRAIDRAVGERVRIKRNLDNAIQRRNKVCGEVADPTTPPVAAPPAGETKVVWCVLKPGTCSEVEVDSQGQLVRVIRQVNCGNEQLPPVSGVKRGEKVTVVDHRVVERVIERDPGSVTYLPGTGTVDPAPVPQTLTPSDGYPLPPVTH